jgi:hypothetical protein
MYSTCLFCHTELGANEAVEHFPVGRRLAFDAAKGRLWVVCRKCERWNLTPLEERWEAIEECERSFRATKLRTSTDQIGLARLSEGLELVRIGQPLRPEFAAWRYGDQFGRRRRRNIIRISAMAVGAAAVPILGPTLGISLGATGVYSLQLANFGKAFYHRMKVVERLTAADGSVLPVRRHEVNEATMLPAGGRESWGLRISHHKPRDPGIPWWRYDADAETTDIRGEHAMRAAARLLPHLNRTGASGRVVSDAVKLATRDSDPTKLFEKAARFVAQWRGWNDSAFSLFAQQSDFSHGKGARLAKIPADLRLALEMISHEESERRAMEGELMILENAWREAEEIAAISDDMFLPEDISKRLAEMKRH